MNNVELIQTTPAKNVFRFKGEEYTIYQGSELVWKGGCPASQEEDLAFNAACEA